MFKQLFIGAYNIINKTSGKPLFRLNFLRFYVSNRMKVGNTICGLETVNIKCIKYIIISKLD